MILNNILLNYKNPKIFKLMSHNLLILIHISQELKKKFDLKSK